MHHHDYQRNPIWSSAWPQSPPPAQPDRIQKVVWLEERQYGVVHAAPTATVSDVLDDLWDKVMPLSPFLVNPISAVLWHDVEFLEIDLPVAAQVPTFVDLRGDRWERLQKIRHVPVLEDGIVVNTVLLPWHMYLADAQDRLEECMIRDLTWRITAIDHENWVITSPQLPARVQDDLSQLNYLRRQREEERGGMKRSNHRTISVTESPEGPSYLCEFAYVDSTPFLFKSDHQESVVAELVCGIAIDHNLHTDDVAVTVADWCRIFMTLYVYTKGTSCMSS